MPAQITVPVEESEPQSPHLQAIAPGADPISVPAALQRQAGELDAAQAADVQQSQANAAALTANAQASRDVAVSGLQAQAGQALEAVGGNLPAGSEGVLGAALRDPVDAANQAAKSAERQVYAAIDPDGTLGVAMQPISNGARRILGEVSPNAAPLAGNEASIFQTAANLPPVQSFKDLAALRSRITDSIRQERTNPQADAQSVPRLSQLLDTVHQAMDGAVVSKDFSDQAAVAAGTMAPEAAIGGRLQAEANAFRAEQQAARVQQGSPASRGGVGEGAQRNAGTGPQTVPGGSGTADEGQGGSGNPAGNPGLQSQPPAVANFDQAAASRYAAARATTAQRAAMFKNAPGVGQILQSGPTSGSFRTPDSAVPNVIVRVGPQGADVAKAYLAAGGSAQGLVMRRHSHFAKQLSTLMAP